MIEFIRNKSLAITQSVAITIIILQIIMPMWLDFITGLMIMGMVYGLKKLEG